MVYLNKEQLIKAVVKKNTDVVLDVGFWGQGVSIKDKNWPHRLLLNKAQAVYGLDLDYDSTQLSNPEHYSRQNAENFSFPVKFDIIFAGDLIEHLSNPGLFLESCRRNLKSTGWLVITTPNCFNLFNLAEKLTKLEPTTNSDHACYFNAKTLNTLLKKNHFLIKEVSYLYTLELAYKESVKKKFLNIIYKILSKFTPKFIETLVVIAQPE